MFIRRIRWDSMTLNIKRMIKIIWKKIDKCENCQYRKNKKDKIIVPQSELMDGINLEKS